MSNYICSNPDCSVSVTDKCVLSHEPVTQCPHVRAADVPEPETSRPDRIEASSSVTVYPGNELGWQQAVPIFAARYSYLIGLLGETGTGKTCLLSSVYLLASCGELRPNFQFAGSFTLPGFESRIRLLRDWSSTVLPDQIVEHTRWADDRQPSLMHLALRRKKEVDGLRDLLITDLPGEWTTEAVRRSEKAQRLEFLKRADAIVIAISAADLLSDETRNSKVQFARVLLQRLKANVGIDTTTRIVFALTRCDLTGGVTPPAIYRIVEAAESFGFRDVAFCLIAAFSDRSDVPSGLGVSKLIRALFERREMCLPARSIPHKSERLFGQYVVEGVSGGAA